MEHRSLHEGVVVCARWRLRGRLGDAGSSLHARVWEAEHVHTRARVAIKFLARAHESDVGAMRRFDRELRSISKLRSQYLVPVVDYGHTDSGLPFIVTELLEGQDLRRFLTVERTFEWDAARRIIDSLCRALAELRAVGLAQRNLEPEHVFLVPGRDGQLRIKLLDLDMARIRSAESVQSREASDVWTVGAVTYRMLAGAWPFAADSWVTLRSQTRGGNLVPRSVRRADLPAALDGWFARAVRIGAAKPFATLDEACAAFGDIAQSKHMTKSIVVPAPGTAAPPHLGWRIAAGGAVLVGLGCLAFRGTLPDLVCGTFPAARVVFLPPSAAAAPREAESEPMDPMDPLVADAPVEKGDEAEMCGGTISDEGGPRSSESAVPAPARKLKPRAAPQMLELPPPRVSEDAGPSIVEREPATPPPAADPLYVYRGF